MVANVESIAPVYGGSMPRPRLGRGRLAVVVALIVMSLLVVVGAERSLTGTSTQSPYESVVVPDQATDGKIAFTIPLGAAEAQLEGATPYVMPAAIRLEAGDAVVVTNDDVYPHIILSSLAMPGATTTITFDEPGIQAFSSGCTANGGTINSFTSVIVSERA
jgi:hypothetical protein